MDVIGAKRSIIMAVINDHRGQLEQMRPSNKELKRSLNVTGFHRGDDDPQAYSTAAVAAQATHREKTILKNIGELNELATQLKNNNDHIGEGSLIQMNSGGEVAWFFILPCLTGKEYEIPEIDGEITVISPHAEIAKQARSVCKGKQFEINGTTHWVIESF